MLCLFAYDEIPKVFVATENCIFGIFGFFIVSAEIRHHNKKKPTIFSEAQRVIADGYQSNFRVIVKKLTP